MRPQAQNKFGIIFAGGVACGMGASLCAPAMLPDLPYVLVSCAFFLLVFLPFLRWTKLLGPQERLWLRQMLQLP